MKKTPSRSSSLEARSLYKIKDFVLGKRYDLSVAFLSPAKMRAVTRLTHGATTEGKTKGKNKVSNVLSFPLSKTSGEILICPSTARTEAKHYGMSERTYLAYLFIHGLLHLKGHEHSATMEREEDRIFKKFGFQLLDAGD